jgi:hypothetical protein
MLVKFILGNGPSIGGLRSKPLALVVLFLAAFWGSFFLNTERAWSVVYVTTPTKQALQSALSSPGPDRTIMFDYSIPGIVFKHTELSLSDWSSPTIIMGRYESNFSNSINNLANTITSQAYSSPSNTAAQLGSLIQTQVSNFVTTAPTNLSYITGDGVTRQLVNLSTDPFYDNNKIIKFAYNRDDLSLYNLNINNFNLLYDYPSSASAGGIVNSFIGSLSNNTNSLEMGRLVGNKFDNITITMKAREDDKYLAGGGILGVRSTAASAEIEAVVGNYFNNIQILLEPVATAGPYLEGGGIIGVNGVSSPAVPPGRAVLDNLQNNLFTNIKVKSADIIMGGGLVGVNNNSQNTSSATYAHLNSATNNVFGNGQDGNIEVSAVYSLRGGAIVGVNALSNAEARLVDLDNNVFAGIKVDVGTYLKGGGIVGVQSNCDASKDCNKGAFDSSYSYLMAASDNVFYNIDLNVGVHANGGILYGGGVIGADANANAAAISTVSNNIFKDININLRGTNTANYKGLLRGGGVVGVESLQSSQIDKVSGNFFDGINVTVTSVNNTLTPYSPYGIFGGGIVGVDSSSSSAYYSVIGILSKNSFKNINVNVINGAIYGGGIVGINSPSGNSSIMSVDITGPAPEDFVINGIDYNVFANNTITAQKGIYGGGVIGLNNSEAGLSLLGPTKGNDFYNNNINALFIEGGGIIGTQSQGLSLIYGVNSSNFLYNTVTVDKYIDGGGIVGATGSSTSYVLAGVHEIKNSFFLGNTVTAKDGIIMGGLVYSYGTMGEALLIEGSWFENNTFITTSPTDLRGTYGTITIDTGVNTAGLGVATVKLAATADSSVVFHNNVIKHNSDPIRRNSLYFGNIPEYEYNFITDSVVTSADFPEVDANLQIETVEGGSVALFDPILVDQTGVDEHDFTMDVRGNGDFVWGGSNLVLTNPGVNPNENRITFYDTSKTTIMDGWNLTAQNNIFDLQTGARLNVLGHNSMNVNTANLNGTMWFNLNNTTVNDPSTALLKVTAANPVNVAGAKVLLSDIPAGPMLQPGDRFYLIDGASGNLTRTIQDGINQSNQATKMASARQGLLINYNFIIDDAAPTDDHIGQYLVARLPYRAPQTGDPLVVYTKSDVGDPLVVYFKTAVGNPLMVEFKEAVGQPLYVEFKTAVGEPLVVEVRDAVGEPLVVYTKSAVGEPLMVEIKEAVGEPPVVYIYSKTGEPLFKLIDDFPTNLNSDTLTPGFPYVELVPDSKLLVDSQVAALGFISQTTSWLPDHSYQEANVGVGRTRVAPSAGAKSLSEPSWTPFAGLDGAYITNGNKTKIRTNSTRMEAGISYRKPFDASQFLATAFVEASFGRYQIEADYGTLISTHVKGKGTLESLAAGLALRQKWNNGLRLEGSVRAGRLRNHFSSDAFTNYFGHKMDYKYESPYWGLHAGLGYELRLNERSSLDFTGRYYWTGLKGDSVVLQSGEVVRFDNATSSRVRAGVRFTRDHNERMTYYVGGYWEEEFDGRTNAKTQFFPFYSDELKGTTAVGEIGIIFRSTEDRPWNVEAGIQGYAGRNRGFSGGVRFGYRF